MGSRARLDRTQLCSNPLAWPCGVSGGMRVAPRAGAALPAQNAGGARSGETPRGKWGLAPRRQVGSRLPRHGGEMEAQRGPSCPAGPWTPGAEDKEPLCAAEGLGALLSREAAARAAAAWAVGGLVPPPTGWLGSRHPGGNFPRDTDVGGRGRCEGTHGCSAGLLGRWLRAGRWWGEKPASRRWSSPFHRREG